MLARRHRPPQSSAGWADDLAGGRVRWRILLLNETPSCILRASASGSSAKPARSHVGDRRAIRRMSCALWATSSASLTFLDLPRVAEIAHCHIPRLFRLSIKASTPGSELQRNFAMRASFIAALALLSICSCAHAHTQVGKRAIREEWERGPALAATSSDSGWACTQQLDSMDSWQQKGGRWPGRGPWHQPAIALVHSVSRDPRPTQRAYQLSSPPPLYNCMQVLQGRPAAFRCRREAQP